MQRSWKGRPTREANGFAVPKSKLKAQSCKGKAQYSSLLGWELQPSVTLLRFRGRKQKNNPVNVLIPQHENKEEFGPGAREALKHTPNSSRVVSKECGAQSEACVEVLCWVEAMKSSCAAAPLLSAHKHHHSILQSRWGGDERINVRCWCCRGTNLPAGKCNAWTPQ